MYDRSLLKPLPLVPSSAHRSRRNMSSWHFVGCWVLPWAGITYRWKVEKREGFIGPELTAPSSKFPHGKA